MSEKWTVARARGRFADLLSAVLQEPQAIFNRNKKVAVMVDAETFDEFQAWRESRRNSTLWDDFHNDRPNSIASIVTTLIATPCVR